VNVLEGKLVLSERAAMLEAVAAALNPGDVVEGVVTRLADYGAFVSLRSPDGNLHGVKARAWPQCRTGGAPVSKVRLSAGDALLATLVQPSEHQCMPSARVRGAGHVRPSACSAFDAACLCQQLAVGSKQS